MVLLTITLSMIEALEYLQNAEKSIERQEYLGEHYPEEPSLENPSLGNPISHGQVVDLSRRCYEVTRSRGEDVSKGSSVYSLENLLRGSRVDIKPSKAKVEPSSEYRALMAQLRQDEESRAYDRMTDFSAQKESFAQRFPHSQHAHLFPTSKSDIGEDDETTYNDINRQLSVIFNVIVSIVACSAAIWIVARQWSTPTRLGLSMGGSGLVGAAEVVVYAGYLRRVKEAKLKEKKAVEVKEVVDTWVIKGKNCRTESEKTLPTETMEPALDGLRKRVAISKAS